jgi:hypothetical protein
VLLGLLALWVIAWGVWSALEEPEPTWLVLRADDTWLVSPRPGTDQERGVPVWATLTLRDMGWELARLHTTRDQGETLRGIWSRSASTHRVLRRRYRLPALSRAFLTVRFRGDLELWVNEQRVAPLRVEHPRELSRVVYDLAGVLRPGLNVIVLDCRARTNEGVVQADLLATIDPVAAGEELISLQRTRHWLVLAAGLALIALPGAALAWIAGRHATPRATRAFRRRLLALLGATALTLGGLELAARRLLPETTTQPQPPPEGCRRRAPDGICLDLLPPAEHSGWRIMFAGDSFTFGAGVPPEESFPARVPALLRARAPSFDVDSVNIGVPGMGTADVYRMIDAYLPIFQPDLVVYTYVLNDPIVEGEAARKGIDVEDFIVTRRLASRERLHISPLWEFRRRLRLVDFLASRFEARRLHRETIAFYRALHGEWNRRGIAQTFAVIESMAQRCAPAPLVVAIMPLLIDLNSDYPFAAIHQRIRTELEQRQIPVIDLLPAFLGRAPRTITVSPTDHHPNSPKPWCRAWSRSSRPAPLPLDLPTSSRISPSRQRAPARWRPRESPRLREGCAHTPAGWPRW